MGQEARKGVNRLIVAKDRPIGSPPPAIHIAQKPSSSALNADASTAGSPGNPKPSARSRSRCPRMVCSSACLICDEAEEAPPRPTVPAGASRSARGRATM